MKRASIEDRIWSKIVVVENCWEWLGALDECGYGRLRLSKRKLVPAHRASFETFRGTIPDGLEIDHLCRNRRCVNPWHLEPVTHTENMRRGYHATRALCRLGHPMDAIVHIASGPRAGHSQRVCRECRNTNGRRTYAERKHRQT